MVENIRTCTGAHVRTQRSTVVRLWPQIDLLAVFLVEAVIFLRVIIVSAKQSPYIDMRYQ